MSDPKIGADADGLATDRHPLRDFTRALLEDLQALERMIESGMLESDVRRVGAEQELFLVDQRMRPAMTSLEILEKLGHHPQVQTELGLFNLEINLTPHTFEGDCLWQTEEELENLLAEVSRAARTLGTRLVLTGILPTLRRSDLTLDSMTPSRRYRELNRSTLKHRGGEFRLHIKGLDELNMTHGNVMCEASNTSFQIHFQLGPEEFALLYNLAQAVTAPVLAAAVNSPVFLQHRLWNETRLAVFEQSIDSRSDAQQARQARSRVVFGDRWVERSVLEVFREDVARFRVFLPTVEGASSLEQLRAGEVPSLAALCLHNGTVYRWNRPCYGVLDGKPHLRIEHRVLPSGPTVLDEMANATFFFGLMCALGDEYGDVTRSMSFDDAKHNVMTAARYGLKARFQWLDGRSVVADELILGHLLPMARQGLAAHGIRGEDVDRYLGTLEERVRMGRTGARWVFESLAEMGDRGRLEDRHRALTRAMYEYSIEGRPVHRWETARLEDGWEWLENYRTVEQVMTSDLFTVRPDDLIDLAANLMDWEHIRHVPVEDQEGHLVGLVSHRQLLRTLARREADSGPIAVQEIMTTGPVTASPDLPIREAIARMRLNRVSCLPVVDGEGRLVGIVSERDFIKLTAHLLEEVLRDGER